MSGMTSDRLEELRRVAAETAPGTHEWHIIETALALLDRTIETALALLDENERLRREREALVEALAPAGAALADLDKGYYRVAKQDPGGYVMGSVSVASLVTTIEATRKALALLDGEKGDGYDGR